MKTPNLFYSSAAISNKIYVIGGKSNGQSINTVEYFEVEKMTWINGPKLLQKIRSHDSIVVDGIIYAVGDLESKKFQRLDEREGKWTFLPDILNLTCNTALSAFGQTLTCAGSWTAPSPGAVVNGISESFCQIYDIRNSKWNQMTKLVVPVWGAKSIENETSIFVAGGLNNLTIQEYNKNNKLWAILNIKLPSMKHRCSKIVL
uniref:Uncharacterized protein n=1 Tax=Rhabditophanes sp. KR3021 TaxID=114890 RepID=A0AC35TGL6_9BILA